MSFLDPPEGASGLRIFVQAIATCAIVALLTYVALNTAGLYDEHTNDPVPTTTVPD